MNGLKNQYLFTIKTEIVVIAGDTFSFTVPSQVGLPATEAELNI